MRKVRIGISPCPNDTFIFHALLHDLVETEGLEFEPFMMDVEELNRLALAGELEVTKASYGVVPQLADRYWCLRSGGAMGRGCGPLLVSSQQTTVESLRCTRIAHPGVNTTAHLLLQLRFDGEFEGVPMLFSEVIDKIAANEVPSGVIIHEGRFTFAEKGLHKVEDLGDWWESTTGLPIPLGVILCKRDANDLDPVKVDRAIRRSVHYAFDHPEASGEFVRAHAQELSKEVTQEHIRLYVNGHSVDIGELGERAVTLVMERSKKMGRDPVWDGPIFPPDSRA